MLLANQLNSGVTPLTHPIKRSRSRTKQKSKDWRRTETFAWSSLLWFSSHGGKASKSEKQRRRWKVFPTTRALGGREFSRIKVRRVEREGLFRKWGMLLQISIHPLASVHSSSASLHIKFHAIIISPRPAIHYQPNQMAWHDLPTLARSNNTKCIAGLVNQIRPGSSTDATHPYTHQE